jgi:molybdopterin/thiamine biosynthesis adenylyltransferase
MEKTMISSCTKQIVLIGMGGVGTHLEPFLRYVSYKWPDKAVVLVDGDTYENRNKERQSFQADGNKATVKALELEQTFPNLNFIPIPEYVTTDNIAGIVPEGSCVLCAVDNHPSRTLISEYMESLDDGMLISGGNDYHDGTVQIHVRQDGRNLTPPITQYHPEINKDNGKHPLALSCLDAAETSPQLVLANNMVATLMAALFWRFEQAVQAAEEANKPVDFPTPEMYFDLTTGSVRPARRNVIMETVEDGSDTKEVALDETGRSGRVARAGNAD